MEAEQKSNLSKPANLLAKQIILSVTASSQNGQQTLQQLCQQLKQRKNHSHEKFSTNIANQLYMMTFSKKKSETNIQMQAQKESEKQKNVFEFAKSVETMLQISIVMKKMGNSGYHQKSIINGFTKFWLSVTKGYNVVNKMLKKRDEQPVDQSSRQDKKQLIYEMYQTLKKQYFQFIEAMSESILLFLLELELSISAKEKQKTREYFSNQIEKRMHSSVAMPICCLIHYFNLQRNLSHRVIPIILVNSNIAESYIAFTAYPSNNPDLDLVEQFICKTLEIKNIQQALETIKKLVSILKLDPFRYPVYLKQLNKKSLRYFLNNQDIFFLQLKICKRQDLLQIIVEMLISSNRQNEAVHFINKYHLKRFYDYRRQNTKYMKNVLIQKDSFTPTQNILNRSQNCQFLTLQKFGYSENSVIFIDSSNFQFLNQHLETIEKSGTIGIDTESIPAFNAYEFPQTALLQVATKNNVYLFDILSLRTLRLFAKWLHWFLNGCRAKMIGITLQKELKELYTEVMSRQQKVEGQETGKKDIESELLEKLNEFNPNFQGTEQEIKAETIDVSQFYKRKFPKDTKSSLQHMCNILFGMKLSKYQQCSGWDVRPLRKTQIHYAALDAVLPIAVHQKLRQ